MNSGSYYAHAPATLRLRNLARRHHRSAARRSAPAASRRLARHLRSVRRQFSVDGLARAPALRSRAAAARAIPCRRRVRGVAYSAARSIFLRVLSRVVSKHGSAGGRSFRRVAVVVLRRSDRRSADSAMAKIVSARPNLLAGENLPAAPLQKRSLEKRARLKTAGLALFGEKGYENTSIDEIARRSQLAVGSFYQHFRSKRQLLLALMDELLEKLSQLNLQPQAATDARAGLRGLLSRAFSHDLRYLGAYRAWQEAALSDAGLVKKQKEIHKWTTSRVLRVFQFLQSRPGAREKVDVLGLARAMDTFFWSLLAQAGQLRRAELDQWIDSATHLIYHAMFTDSPSKR